jgi:hypothetical protein
LDDEYAASHCIAGVCPLLELVTVVFLDGCPPFTRLTSQLSHKVPPASLLLLPNHTESISATSPHSHSVLFHLNQPHTPFQLYPLQHKIKVNIFYLHFVSSIISYRLRPSPAAEPCRCSLALLLQDSHSEGRRGQPPPYPKPASHSSISNLIFHRLLRIPTLRQFRCDSNNLLLTTV